MIRYLDTSVLVAALTREAETERMLSWLDAQSPEELAISDWVITEFSSALSLKLRAKQIKEAHRASALAMFTAMCAETFTTLPISNLEFQTAARFANQHTLGLRAGDALHLAICADHGATLCTLDRKLSAAGTVVAVKTLLL